MYSVHLPQDPMGMLGTDLIGIGFVKLKLGKSDKQLGTFFTESTVIDISVLGLCI